MTLASSSGVANVVAFVNSTSGASYGSLFASAEGTYLEGDTDQAAARGYAEFRDTLTVSSPGSTARPERSWPRSA